MARGRARPGGRRVRVRSGAAGAGPGGGPDRLAVGGGDDPAAGEAARGVAGRGPGAAARLDAVPGGGVGGPGAAGGAADRTRSCCWSSPAGSEAAGAVGTRAPPDGRCGAAARVRPRSPGRALQSRSAVRRSGGRSPRRPSAPRARRVRRSFSSRTPSAERRPATRIFGTPISSASVNFTPGETPARSSTRTRRPAARQLLGDVERQLGLEGLARGDDVHVGRGDLARASTGPARRRSARRGRRPRGRRRCRTSPWSRGPACRSGRGRRA